MKVTTKLGNNHTLAGIYQADRLHMLNVGATITSLDEVLSTAATLRRQADVGVGQQLTTTFTVGYNNKGGNDLAATTGACCPGPRTNFHPAATVRGHADRTGCSDERRQPSRLHGCICSTRRR